MDRNLSDLTLEELETIITDSRNVIKSLQQKCDDFENRMDKLKQKSKMVQQKMQQDLNDVVKRYVNDVGTKGYFKK